MSSSSLLSSLPVDDGDLAVSLDSKQLDSFLSQFRKALPDSSSSSLSRLPSVSPAQLQERIHAIRAFHTHLLPAILAAEDDRDADVISCLSLSLNNSHALVVQSLAAASLQRSASQEEDAERSLEVPRLLLSVLSSLMKLATDESNLDLRWWKSVPESCLRILVSVFEHCRDCHRDRALSQGYQKKLHELFKECKEVMNGTEVALGTANAGRPVASLVDSDDERTEKILLDTVHRLADLVIVLPKLDSKYFGRMARLFLDLCRRRRDVLTDRLEAKPAGVLAVAAELAMELAEAVGQASRHLDGGGGAGSYKKLSTDARKLTFLLRLVKELADLFCDKLGSEFGPLTGALARCVSMNDARVEFDERIPEETRQCVTSGLTALAQAAAEELMIDQGFATYLLGLDLGEAEDEADGVESLYELCHLFAFLLHRLPHKNDGTRNLWMANRGANLLSRVLSLSARSAEFNAGPLVIGVEHGGRGRQAVGAYEHVLTLCQSFVMGASVKEMQVVERTLLAAVVKARNFWEVKLASDIWSFIGRYGSGDLCCSHVLSLVDVFLSLPAGHSSRDSVSHILNRLTAFLAPDGLRELEQKLLNGGGGGGNVDAAKLSVIPSVRLDLCGEGFRRAVTLRCLDVFGAFASKGELPAGTEAVSSAVSALAKLVPTLPPDCFEEVTKITMDVWAKLAERKYVPSSVEWFVELFRDLIDLTKNVVPGLPTPEQQDRTVANVWSVVANSAYDASLCFVFLDLLSHYSLPDGDEGRVWGALLLASSSDALLELKCFETLRKRTKGARLKLEEGVGVAVQEKLLKFYEEGGTAATDPLIDVEHMLRMLEVTTAGKEDEEEEELAFSSDYQEEGGGDGDVRVETDDGGLSALKESLEAAMALTGSLPGGRGDAVAARIRDILDAL